MMRHPEVSLARPAQCWTRRPSGARAFTIIELLVVVAIIILGTTLVVPAVGRVLESNNYASAINLVTGALGSARAEAIRTGKGTAVVFLYDIDTQVMTLQVCEQRGRQSGSLSDLPSSSWRGNICPAYRPVLGSIPVQLPRGTAVYGLSFSLASKDLPNSRIDQRTSHWYAGEIINEDSVSPVDPPVHPWIFPRNDVRLFSNGTWDQIWTGQMPDSSEVVRHANTFMIQFDESGQVVTSTRPGTLEPTENAYLEWDDAPVLRDDPRAGTHDDPYRFDPEAAFEGDNLPTGDPAAYTPNPEVVLRSAHQLAVVDINRLGREAGVREPWLVRWADATHAPMSDRVQALYSTGDPEARVRLISNWIDQNGEILSFNRFTGQVLRRAQQ